MGREDISRKGRRNRKYRDSKGPGQRRKGKGFFLALLLVVLAAGISVYAVDPEGNGERLRNLSIARDGESNASMRSVGGTGLADATNPLHWMAGQGLSNNKPAITQGTDADGKAVTPEHANRALVWYGSYGGQEILWRVLESSGSTDVITYGSNEAQAVGSGGTLGLWSEYALDKAQYHTKGYFSDETKYTSCKIYTTMGNMGTAITGSIPGNIPNVITETSSRVNHSVRCSPLSWSDTGYTDTFENQSVFLLSYEEVLSYFRHDTTADTARIGYSLDGTTGYVWTRSPSGGFMQDERDGWGIQGGGKLSGERILTNNNGIRPAVNLNPTGIVLTAAAANGSSSAAPTTPSLAASSSTVNGAGASASNTYRVFKRGTTDIGQAQVGKSDSELAVKWTGVTDTSNSYINMMMVNTTTYEKWRARVAKASKTSGQIAVALPSGLHVNSTGYRIFAWVENESTKTTSSYIDYADLGSLPSLYTPVTGISLNKTELTLDLTAGPSQGTLSAAVTPDGATNTAVTWATDHSDVATVKDGVVTAVKNGTAKITATSVDQPTLKASCTVTVRTSPTAVALDRTADTLYTNGGGTKSLTLTATVSPATADYQNGVTWTSSNASAATVKDGVVTAAGPGTAVITASTGNKKTASCTIDVRTVPEGLSITGIPASKVLVVNGDGSERQPKTIELGIAYNPANANDALDVTWNSTHPEIAAVTGGGTNHASGTVTAVSPGTAVITAGANGYTSSNQVEITVVQKAEQVTVTDSRGETSGRLDHSSAAVLALTATASSQGGTPTEEGIQWSVTEGAELIELQEDKTDTHKCKVALKTGGGNGTAKVKAKAADGYGAEAVYTVTVVTSPQELSITGIPESGFLVCNGSEGEKKAELKAAFSPESTSEKGITWSIVSQSPADPQKTEVLSIEETGHVTALSRGTAVIRVQSQANESVTTTTAVTVKERAVYTYRSNYPGSEPAEKTVTKDYYAGETGTPVWDGKENGSEAFTKTGYTLTGWSQTAKPEDSAPDYPLTGGEFTPDSGEAATENHTFYGVWESSKYEITLHGRNGGGAGGSEGESLYTPAVNSFPHGQNAKLQFPADTFRCQGKSLLGFAYSEAGAAQGSVEIGFGTIGKEQGQIQSYELQIPGDKLISNLDLYAVWGEGYLVYKSFPYDTSGTSMQELSEKGLVLQFIKEGAVSDVPPEECSLTETPSGEADYHIGDRYIGYQGAFLKLPALSGGGAVTADDVIGVSAQYSGILQRGDVTTNGSLDFKQLTLSVYQEGKASPSVASADYFANTASDAQGAGTVELIKAEDNQGNETALTGISSIGWYTFTGVYTPKQNTSRAQTFTFQARVGAAKEGERYILTGVSDWNAYLVSGGLFCDNHSLQSSYLLRFPGGSADFGNLAGSSQINGGSIDGNGQTITNLTRPLFQRISNANVTDLIIQEADIRSDVQPSDLDAAAQRTGSTVTAANIGIDTDSGRYAGALANIVSGASRIENCIATGVIDGTSITGTITNVSSTNTGGLIGKLTKTSKGVPTVRSSGSAMTVTGEEAGGLAAENAQGSVKQCYATGAVIGNTAGTLVGNNNQGVIDSSYGAGTIRALEDSTPGSHATTEGLIGTGSKTGISGSYYDRQMAGIEAGTTADVRGKSTQELISGKGTEGLNGFVTRDESYPGLPGIEALGEEGRKAQEAGVIPIDLLTEVDIATQVKGGLKVPTSTGGQSSSPITWSSKPEGILSIDQTTGVVQVQKAGEKVILTASCQGYQKEFTLTTAPADKPEIVNIQITPADGSSDYVWSREKTITVTVTGGVWNGNVSENQDPYIRKVSIQKVPANESGAGPIVTEIESEQAEPSSGTETKESATYVGRTEDGKGSLWTCQVSEAGTYRITAEDWSEPAAAAAGQSTVTYIDVTPPDAGNFVWDESGRILTFEAADIQPGGEAGSGIKEILFSTDSGQNWIGPVTKAEDQSGVEAGYTRYTVEAAPGTTAGECRIKLTDMVENTIVRVAYDESKMIKAALPLQMMFANVTGLKEGEGLFVSPAYRFENQNSQSELEVTVESMTPDGSLETLTPTGTGTAEAGPGAADEAGRNSFHLIPQTQQTVAEDEMKLYIGDFTGTQKYSLCAEDIPAEGISLGILKARPIEERAGKENQKTLRYSGEGHHYETSGQSPVLRQHFQMSLRLTPVKK